eukprot:11181513-Alexandrium_andersonii.AAC.1
MRATHEQHAHKTHAGRMQHSVSGHHAYDTRATCTQRTYSMRTTRLQHAHNTHRVHVQPGYSMRTTYAQHTV